MNKADMLEFEDFLDRVEEVKYELDQITKGLSTDDSLQKSQDKFDAKKTYKQKLKKLEEEEKKRVLLQGRSGKGEKENYKMFCTRCETEFLIDLTTCTRCGHELITQKERRDNLLLKVEDYK